MLVLGLDYFEVRAVGAADGLGCLVAHVALAVKVFGGSVHSITRVEAHILVHLLKITIMMMLIRIRHVPVL